MAWPEVLAEGKCRLRDVAAGFGLFKAASKNSFEASFTLFGLHGSGVMGCCGDALGETLYRGAAGRGVSQEAGIMRVGEGLADRCCHSLFWLSSCRRVAGDARSESRFACSSAFESAQPSEHPHCLVSVGHADA